MSILRKQTKKMLHEYARNVRKGDKSLATSVAIMLAGTQLARDPRGSRSGSSLLKASKNASLAFNKLRWASTDSSIEFLEAVLFMQSKPKVCEQTSGILIGRTDCQSSEMISDTENFTQLVRAAGKKRKIRVFYMPTIDYLFRNQIDKTLFEKRMPRATPVRMGGKKRERGW